MAKPRLIYISNNRLPTERAHGLQIVQMCEAFAATGYDVTLVAPRRINTRAMRAVRSLWEYYAVEANFEFRRLWCVDLFPIFPRHHVAFLTQTFTFLLALSVWLLGRHADVFYTRDIFVATLVALVRPRTTLAYEVHQIRRSALGRKLQTFVARRAYVIPITGHLGDYMRQLGTPDDRLLVAHDGIRRARFEPLLSQTEARARLGWPADAFIVGWVGRLSMLGMDKGVGTLVAALQAVEQTTLAVVGGPEDAIESLRAGWLAVGLAPERFLAPGHVSPADVPLYLAACDVCAMPHPWTEHFAYFTSPIKLFEYMAAGRALVSSNLPGFAEVVTHEESALLVPPGDSEALAAALHRLRDDPALRERLGQRARQLALELYTWRARADAIKVFLSQDMPEA